jgi:hypothetical protein
VSNRWERVVAAKAAPICAKLALPDRVRGLLRANPDAAIFFKALVARGEHESATTFLAHALPPREGVWWACLCAEAAHGENLPKDEEIALLAAVRWVLEPTEANRRAAEAPGKALGIISLCGNLALAAFWSGGSINPPDRPLRPPPPGKTAETIAYAVTRTVDVVFPRCRDVGFRQFLALGEGVATDQYRWPAAV